MSVHLVSDLASLVLSYIPLKTFQKWKQNHSCIKLNLKQILRHRYRLTSEQEYNAWLPLQQGLTECENFVAICTSGGEVGYEG